MKNHLRKFLEWIYLSVGLADRHRGALISAVLLALILSAFALPALRLEIDIYDMNDPRFPSTIQFQRMKKIFHDVDAVQIILRPKDQSDFTNVQICGLIEHFRLAANSMSDVSSIHSAFNLRLPSFDGR